MKMTFVQKLASIIGVLIVVVIVITWIGLVGVNNINSNLNKIVDVDSEKVKLAARMQQNLLEMHRAEKNMILAITADDIAEYEKNYNDAKNDLEVRREKLIGLVDESNKEKLNKFKSSYENFQNVSLQVQSLTKENSNEKAKQLLRTEARTEAVKVDELTNQLRVLLQKDIDSELNKEQSDTQALIRKIEAFDLIALVESNMLKSVRDTGRAILLLNDDEIKEMVDRSNMFLQETYKAVAHLKEMTDNDKHKLIDEINDALKRYDAVQTKILNLTQRNSNQKAFELSTGAGKKAISESRDIVFFYSKR